MALLVPADVVSALQERELGAVVMLAKNVTALGQAVMPTARPVKRVIVNIVPPVTVAAIPKHSVVYLSMITTALIMKQTVAKRDVGTTVTPSQIPTEHALQVDGHFMGVSANDSAVS